MNKTVKRLHALHQLVQQTVEAGNDQGFYFEDKANELQELADYAQESITHKAVFKVLDEILDAGTVHAMPENIHMQILKQKHAAETKIKVCRQKA